MTYFETIKCEDEEAFNLVYHQKRMARTVGININLQDYIYPPNNKLLKCKVTYDDTGILNVEYTPYLEKNINSFKLIYDDNISYKYKQSNRDNLNDLYNMKQNADDIIIIKNGFVTDTSIANIAIYDGVKWISPKSPLLEGTTKQRLFDEGELVFEDISVLQLQNTKKLVLMNAMIGFKIVKNFVIID